MIADAQTHERDDSFPSRGRERRAVLLDLLRDIADERAPMVPNRVLAKRLGCGNDAVMRHLAYLTRGGHIAVEFTPDGIRRRVTIVATGAVTAWQPKHKSGGPRRRVTRPSAALPPAGQPKGGLRLTASIMPMGIPDRALYGPYTDAVATLRRAGDVVTLAGSATRYAPGVLFVVNDRTLDGEQVAARADRVRRTGYGTTPAVEGRKQAVRHA